MDVCWDKTCPMGYEIINNDECVECPTHPFFKEYYYVSTHTCESKCEGDEARISTYNGLWICCLKDDQHEAC